MANFSQMQKRAENITRLEASKLVSEMSSQYREALKRITVLIEKTYKKQLNNIDPQNYYNKLLEIGRLKLLKKQTIDIYNFYAKKAGENLIDASTLSFTNNYYRQQYTKSWFAPLSKIKVVMDFALVDPMAVKLSVESRSIIYDSVNKRAQKEYLSGFKVKGSRKSTKEYLIHNANKGATKIADAITQGLIAGSSLPKITKEITKAMDWSKNISKRFARTEVHKNLNGGQYASYIDAKEQGLLDRRMIVSVLDIRTRQQSAIVDGRKDDENNEFTYPGGVKVSYPGNSGRPEWDVNDRETTIEIIEGITPQLRRAIDPFTGETKVVSFQTFNKWAKENNIGYNNKGILVYKKPKN